MAPKFYETEEFQKLNEEWYQKLKDTTFADGETFKDLEASVEDYTHLQLESPMQPSSVAYKSRESVEAYYDAVREFLHRGTFSNEKERTIWEMHCEGLSRRKIAKKLGMAQTTVQYYLKKLRKRMDGFCGKV